MSDYSKLKNLAEALIAHEADSFYLPCTVAFERAATPVVVLTLIAENEKLKVDLREAKDAKLGLSWAIGEIMGERAQLKAENEALRKDAERYRWLRAQHWAISEMAVATYPKESIRLGYDCPFGERLDAQIDAALSKESSHG